MFDNVVFQVSQHQIHMLQDIVVRRAEHVSSKPFQEFVAPCIIIQLFVVGAAVYLHNQSETFYIEINNVDPDDFLSVKIEPVEQFPVYL